MEIIGNTKSKSYSNIHPLTIDKLYSAFLNWITKLSSFIRNKRETIIFQINNFFLLKSIYLTEISKDFLKIIDEKLEFLISKFVESELNHNFSDLIALIDSSAGMNFEKKLQSIQNLTNTIKTSIKKVVKNNSSTFYQEFSSIDCAQMVFQNFQSKFIKIYSKYLEMWERDVGKTKKSVMDEPEPPSISQIVFIFENI